MCSIDAARIARICAAIEELASRPQEPDGTSAAVGAVAHSGDMAGRLAEIWTMIADVDPELAKRLPGYLSASD